MVVGRIYIVLGVDLGQLVKEVRKQVKLEYFSNKKLAIDAYNALYQFLAIIRGEGGEPLMDSRGRVTSHLSGLFYRTVNFLEKGIEVVYVFDGKPPELKQAEIEKRMQLREKAFELYKEAVKRGDKEEARKYAMLSTRLMDYMVDDAKRLLDLMGVPWVQAPSEGEAEAAYLATKGYVWAAVSQDYDSLLFGSPKLVRNFTISGRRKLPGKDVYVEVVPEVISLSEILDHLKVTREQLVDIGIMLGTDYNPGGFKGIGPVKALKLIKTYERLEKIPDIKEHLKEIDYEMIRKIFLEPKTTDPEKELKLRDLDEEGIVRFLCDVHDFSEQRVRNAIERIKAKRKVKSATLEQWFM